MKREAITRNKNISRLYTARSSRRVIDLVVRLVSGLSRDEIENKRYRQQEIQKKIIDEDVDVIEEAEYQGRKVKLNDPFRLPTGSDKKFAVYVKNDKGNVVKVEFGDPNAEIKRDDPERRKSFRARHQCDTDPGPKWKARYWSCKMWEKGKTVSELD